MSCKNSKQKRNHIKTFFFIWPSLQSKTRSGPAIWRSQFFDPDFLNMLEHKNRKDRKYQQKNHQMFTKTINLTSRNNSKKVHTLQPKLLDMSKINPPYND